MGQTSIYKLRWPERTGTAADGPDGYMDLATDIETQMIRMRQRSNSYGWQNPNVTVNPAEKKMLIDYLLTPTIPGWVIAEYQVALVGWGPGANHAGNVYAHLGLGATPPVIRTQRWHNRAKGTMWWVTGRVAASTLTLAPLRFQVEVSCDTASSNYVRIPLLPNSIQYYGGKPA